MVCNESHGAYSSSLWSRLPADPRGGAELKVRLVPLQMSTALPHNTAKATVSAFDCFPIS